MNTYTYESNEKLFKESKNLAFKVETLGEIVQNDMTLDSNQIKEYINSVDKLIEDIKNYRIEILNHIVKPDRNK